ncbi:PKD domain-containing protein [Myxococcus stipitatus]|uniref:carboxylesterase family protein n=1 Tax=Myxococcus stipitatus TaxID=83455 RepID=UPI0030D166E8
MIRRQVPGRWKSGFVALSLMLGACGDPGGAEAPQTWASTPSPLVASQIIITPGMVQPDGIRPTLGAYQNLYDEQTLIGDPRGPWTFKPATTWGNVAYNENQYPMGFVIDLGALYDVTQVGVFDTYDNVGRDGYVYFSVGAPGAWTALPRLLTDKWEQWRLVTVGMRTRYLHFARNMDGASNEIVVFGSPAGTAANVPPTASAGLDQTVVLPVSSAQLTGTASDSDGQVVSQQWSQVSGPNSATLSAASTLTATASGLVEGLYEFELRVTDNQGASATSRTKVRVERAISGRGTMTAIEKPANSPGSDYGYILYLPAGYETRDNWPIVFFLHGAEQVGNGKGTELAKVRQVGLPSYYDKNGRDYPFVMVAPQTARNNYWNDWEVQADLNPFIDRILTTYKVNPKRVYLTGLSMGGAGTFAYAGYFPAKLAAAAPVCNGGFGSSLPLGQNIVNANLPIWAVHARDDSLSYSGTAGWFTQIGRAMGMSSTATVMDSYTSPSLDQTAFYRPATNTWQWVDGFMDRDANGQPPERPMIFTLFHTGGHGIWDRVYRDDPRILSWLLAQQRP